MKRFLIALLGIGLSLTLAIFHSVLKLMPVLQLHGSGSCTIDCSSCANPKSPDLEILGTSSLSQRCRFTHF